MGKTQVPRQIRLQLPEPPNSLQQEGSHWSYRHKTKFDYMKRCWRAAYYQQLPYAHRVVRQIRWRVSAHFRLRNKRDPTDNLPGSLKAVLDALKAKHPAQASLKFKKTRDGWLGTEKAYIYDDDDTWLVPGQLHQEIVRQKPEDEFNVTPSTRGVELVLTMDKVYPATKFVERKSAAT